MQILSIDIGIINLGMSFHSISNDFQRSTIEEIFLVDITKYICDKKVCLLDHSNHLSDRIAHLFQEYNYYFDSADYILLEKQPICGLISVEQLIYSYYRDKCVLIHPSSMHRFFHIESYDYDGRKDQTIRIASRYMNETTQIKYKSFTRQHDIADSICILVFWKHQQLEKQQVQQRRHRIQESFKVIHKVDMNDFFEKFKYRN